MTAPHLPDRPLFDPPLVAFGAFALLAYAVGALFVVPALTDASSPHVLAQALAVDLVVLVPAAWWALVVRRGRAGGWTVTPLVALSLGGAWLVLPTAHHDVLAAAGWAVPVLEVAVLLTLLVRSRRAVRAYRSDASPDLLDRLRAATAAALGPGVAAEAFAYEAALFRYALGPAPRPSGPGLFGGRRASGYGVVLGALLLAAAVELVAVHFLIRDWGTAWVVGHAALAAYTALWLVGDFRALGARPHRLDAADLHVRCGLRWSADVPLGQIREVYAVPTAPPKEAGYLAAVPLDRVTHVVETAAPVAVRGPYGLRREATRIGFCVDEPDRFAKCLRALVGDHRESRRNAR